MLDGPLSLQTLAMYASIPLTSALVGWGTNVLALKMTFYPLEFVGLKPYLGWQGIIPAKALKMANTTVEMITTRLVGVEEVFDRLDPERVVQELLPSASSLIEQIIDEVMRTYEPELWAGLPEYVKREIYDKATRDARPVIHESLEQVKLHIADLFDLKKMAVEALLRDKSFLNAIFLECGRQEFKLIERSGFYFGLIFGLLQMALWMVYQGAWVLPVMGFLVGYLTNVLALKLIFEPKRPRVIGPWRIQGMFLKRQAEVSEAYARMITQNIVNTQNIMRAILHGEASGRLTAIIAAQVNRSVEAYAGLATPLVRFIIGSKDYALIKAQIAEGIVQGAADGPIQQLHGYAEEALDIERTLRERLTQLPAEQFEGLLRPVFQEDELKLILVGAALGLGAGIFQLLVVFGG